MFGIIFVCLLMSTLLAVACFGIHFFTHSQPVLNQLIWLEALFCFIILEHCAMIETHIQKKTVLVILGMAFVTIDIHLIEQFECYLAKSINFLHNYSRNSFVIWISLWKSPFFLSNTFHFDEKLKKIYANVYHDPYPCMWYL